MQRPPELIGIKRVGAPWRHLCGLGTYENTKGRAYCVQGFENVNHVKWNDQLTLSNGVLFINPGYQFSPTGPVPDTPEMVFASMIHDALYELGSRGLLPKGWRRKADRVMWKLMLDRAENHPKRMYAYVAWAGVRTLYWPMRMLQKSWAKVRSLAS